MRDNALGRTVGYGYDTRGRRTLMTVRDGGGTAVPDLPDTSWTHDGAGRVTYMKHLDPANHDTVLRQAQMLYDNAGRRTWTGLPNGVETTRVYDRASRLLSVRHSRGGSTLSSVNYTLDAAGNRLRADYQDGTWNRWGYDAAYRIITETNSADGERFYYRYSPGGDRLWHSRAVAFDQNWSDGFERVEIGADYQAAGGEWGIADAGGQKWLERLVADPALNTGPALITNSDEIHDGYITVSGRFAPQAGTEAAPLSSALVFAWTDADNYWLAGARCWQAVPDGGTVEQWHLKYFVAEVNNGEMTVRSESPEAEVLGEGVETFELRLEAQPTVLELSRRPAGGDWDRVRHVTNPWSFGHLPASRGGFWCDREAPETVPCRFDDLKIEWASVFPDRTEYSYLKANEGQPDELRTHMLDMVTGPEEALEYGYDADGNVSRMVRDGVESHLEYTYANRLKKVTRGGQVIRSYTFQADSWMRRTASETGPDGQMSTRKLLYDGDQLLAEFGAADGLQAHYATGGLDSALWTVRRDAGTGQMQFSTPLGDGRNIVAVADGAGAITARYRYRAFGKRFTTSGGNPARRDPTFQQRTYDAGLGIYDYRNRSFDPATGRFLQRDPVLDQGNLYNPYVGMGNNPVGNVDPMGLFTYEVDSGLEQDDIIAVDLTLRIPKGRKATPSRFELSAEQVVNRIRSHQILTYNAKTRTVTFSVLFFNARTKKLLLPGQIEYENIMRKLSLYAHYLHERPDPTSGKSVSKSARVGPFGRLDRRSQRGSFSIFGLQTFSGVPYAGIPGGRNKQLIDTMRGGSIAFVMFAAGTIAVSNLAAWQVAEVNALNAPGKIPLPKPPLRVPPTTDGPDTGDSPNAEPEQPEPEKPSKRKEKRRRKRGKEPGQQQEEIEEAQEKRRRRGQGKHIEHTDKSAQRGKRERKDQAEDYLEERRRRQRSPEE